MLELAQKNIPDGEFVKQSIIEFEAQHPYDWIINAFGFPFLDPAQRLKSIRNPVQKPSSKTATSFSASWMETGKVMKNPHSQTIKTSISSTTAKQDVVRELQNNQFELVNEWELDFDIGNGNSLKDVVLIAKKTVI